METRGSFYFEVLLSAMKINSVLIPCSLVTGDDASLRADKFTELF